MIELLLTVPTVFSSVLWTYFWFWLATGAVTFITSVVSIVVVVITFFYFFKWMKQWFQLS